MSEELNAVLDDPSEISDVEELGLRCSHEASRPPEQADQMASRPNGQSTKWPVTQRKRVERAAYPSLLRGALLGRTVLGGT